MLASWIQGMAARDERAFARLHDATSAMVFGLLVRQLKDRTRAEDVAQDVYLQLWRNAESFDSNRGSAWSWIAVMTRSRAIDALRSDRSYGSALSDLETRPTAQPMGGHEPLPDRSAELAQQRGLVEQAMESLTEPQRQTIEAAFFEGWSHREIAERTGVPLGTVKGRIRSAFGILEALLSPRRGEPRGGT
ncbi:sigma-70 family RNA polymerase sigma factor [soil metagenome]